MARFLLKQTYTMTPNRDEEDTFSALERGSEISDPLDDLPSESFEQLQYIEEGTEPTALAEIRKAVRRFGEGDGITKAELEQATEYSRNTIDKHLETLHRWREVYKMKRDKKTDFYYPNGRPLHQYGRKRVECGESIIDIKLAEGRHDKLHFHLTEKRYSLMEGETTEGAIIIPVEAIDDLFSSLQQMAGEVEE
jgi:hypothetical protein